MDSHTHTHIHIDIQSCWQLDCCPDPCDVTASQIREKLDQLQGRRAETNKKWQDKMDHLQIGMFPGQGG